LYKKVSFEEAKKLIDSENPHALLDVRENEEYVTGHADGAVCFPLGSIDEESAKKFIASKDTQVILYCRSGRRSLEAAQKLEALGYENIYDIGGLAGWPYGLSWD